MAEYTELTAIRFSPEMLARLDAYVTKMKADSFGLRASRADAIRMLVARGLDAEGIPAESAPAAAGARRRKR